jgi:hypothetical protein
MATNYKRLASAVGNGVIGTAATIYTASSPTIVSTITICNTSGSTQTFSVGISTVTNTYQTAGYIAYQVFVAPNDTVALTMGVTLDTTNKFLVVSSTSTSVAFNVFGADIT